jgi:phosphoribosyl 1,2-cyclic phosphodiesterase
MRVKFWGVRGTFPATGPAFSRYGGDTMCTEVMCGDTRLILDAGSGLRALGTDMAREPRPVSVHLLISHLHLDHIIGLPHFAPLWRADARMQIYAPRDSVAGDDEALFAVLRPPFFPADAGALAARVGAQEFDFGGSVMPAPGVIVRTLGVNHEGGCAAFVITWRGRKLCYVTDHEHGDAERDAALALAVEGADLLIYDATFTEAEMPAHLGWGHSTWEAGLRLKRRAGVKLLALAHHHPDRTDAQLDALSELATQACSNVFFARQGLALSL